MRELGQCACGDDWKDKFGDINLDRIRKWFNPLSYVEPVKLFATPHHLSDGFITEGSRQAGIIFDRARLCLMADQISSSNDYMNWLPQLKAISEKVIE